MSEYFECPNCHRLLTDQRILSSTDSVYFRCHGCTAPLEYIPGFGVFSASETDLKDSTPESSPKPGTVIVCCILGYVLVIMIVMTWFFLFILR
ncbi:MAG: hypothetical protein QXS20_08675 [Candidatus Thorarchaeota archaeon]